jgi:hypothetical protein
MFIVSGTQSVPLLCILAPFSTHRPLLVRFGARDDGQSSRGPPVELKSSSSGQCRFRRASLMQQSTPATEPSHIRRANRTRQVEHLAIVYKLSITMPLLCYPLSYVME